MALLRTAVFYFAAVFAFAFALGMLRVLIIAPAAGEMAAVLLEIPLVLGASWLVARRLLRDQAWSTTQLCAIGGLALALLLGCEMALAGSLRGQTMAQWLAGLMTPPGLAGLVGQVGFAIIPLLGGCAGRHGSG